MLLLWCRSIGDFDHSDWSIFKNHWRHCRGKFIKVVVLLTTFLILPLHPLPHCLSLSFFSTLLLTISLSPSFPSSFSLLLSLLPLLYFSPSLLSSSYYLSPFFLSFLLTASLPPFSQSSSSLLLLPHSSPSTSSLPLSLLPLPPTNCLSPSSSLLLPPHSSPSILLTTSLPPSSQSSSPPLHPSFLSIRHLITSLLFPVILSSTSLPLSFFRLHPPY